VEDFSWMICPSKRLVSVENVKQIQRGKEVLLATSDRETKNSKGKL